MKDKDELTGWRKVVSRPKMTLEEGNGTLVGVKALGLDVQCNMWRTGGDWRKGGAG